MTLVRTHYIIDLVAGLIISHYVHIISEKLIFFADVKILGLPGIKRKRHWFKPCKCCGWSNKHAGDYMLTNEKTYLKQLHKECKHLLKENNPIAVNIEDDDKVLNTEP